MGFEPLTPASFLRRAARVFPDRVAVIDGDARFTYGELRSRALRLSGALAGIGIAPGDRVAVLSPNSHTLLEAHYGVPMAGAVLVPLNVRLTPDDLSYIVDHAGAKALLFDRQLEDCALEVARRTKLRAVRAPDELETLLERAQPREVAVEDERGLLGINYTSGTTARPKGAMIHHRGAYLQSLAMALHMRLDGDTRYLWTLPMFHCNGWCFTWAVTAAAGTHVCLRAVEPARIWAHLRDSGITHLCAAPTVLSMLFFHPDARPLQTQVLLATGGAAPTPAVLARAAELGIDVTHLYGLTETFGPSVVCEFRPEWSGLPIPEQARIKARQGVENVIGEPVRVVAQDGRDVPADATTLGEIALRGNNVMTGYYRDDEATRRAAPDGWFRTGDLGVMHPDGYVELKDRSKDIIITGGENVSSLEVESALAAHPAVLEAAVVAAPDQRWGEVPVAFVALKQGASATEQEIVEHARARLAHFKAPKRVVFGELPRTATGKIQKYVLRRRVRSKEMP